MDSEQRAMGLVAVIAIIAVIAVAGVATAELISRSEVSIEQTDDELAEVKIVKARQEAGQLLTDLQADINAGVNVATDETRQQIAEVRANLAAAYESTSADLQAEYRELDQELVRVTAQLESDLSATSQSIEDAMMQIEADLDAEAREAWIDTKEAINASISGEANVTVEGGDAAEDGLLDVSADVTGDVDQSTE